MEAVCIRRVRARERALSALAVHLAFAADASHARLALTSGRNARARTHTRAHYAKMAFRKLKLSKIERKCVTLFPSFSKMEKNRITWKRVFERTKYDISYL